MMPSRRKLLGGPCSYLVFEKGSWSMLQSSRECLSRLRRFLWLSDPLGCATSPADWLSVLLAASTV